MLFDELIYDNDQNRFHEMILEKISVILSKNEVIEPLNDDDVISEESGSSLAEVKSKFKLRKLPGRLFIITLLLVFAGLAMDLFLKAGQQGKFFLLTEAFIIPVDASDASPTTATIAPVSSTTPAPTSFIVTTAHRKDLVVHQYSNNTHTVTTQ